MRKPFYVHMQTQGPLLNRDKFRGFTAKITPTDEKDERGHSVCIVQVAYCSRKERAFVKSIGRETASVSEQVKVKVWDLPVYLDDCRSVAWGYKPYSKSKRTNGTSYDFLWKYFVA